MKKLIIDGKIVKCERFLIITGLHERILKHLPSNMWNLSQKLKKYAVQSTISRNLHNLKNVGLITYENIDGREKLWKLKKLETV